MLSPISRAVICSKMRAFSSFPPSMARTPGIFVASNRTALDASGSSLQTRASHSTEPSPFSRSAERFWKAATTEVPLGASSAVSCAAEPCQTPRVREARPPTLEANGTVVSTTMLPARIAGMICLSRDAWPSNGMVSTSRSAAAQAAEFSSPETCACDPTFALIRSAASCARSAFRDPMMMVSPARAHRRANPKPSGPVPPSTAIVRLTRTPARVPAQTCYAGLSF